MDKKKILSSLAAAGILTASVLGANVNAATSNGPVGVYKKLIEGKNVVPYVLEAGETITVKDVQNDFEDIDLVNGSAVIDVNHQLKTGETFKSNGIEYTVLVYGDANKDGKVSILDAARAQQIALNKGETADVYAKLAADVVNTNDNKGNVSAIDAARIQAYVLHKDVKFPENLPAEEEDPSEEETSNYTITVGDNGYVNGTNETDVTLKLDLKETFDEAKKLKVKISGLKDDDSGDKLEQEYNITIPAHTDYVEINSKNNAPSGAGTQFNLSSFKDGNLLIQLLDGETVVGKIETVKNAAPAEVAKVITKRTGTKTATLSLEAAGKDNDIAKIRYVVLTSDGKLVSDPNGNTIAVDDVEDFYPTDTDKKEYIKEITASGNSISDEAIASDLATRTDYVVYFVVENSYGTRTDEVYSSIITTDEETATTPKKVEEVKAPEKLDSNTAEFTWEGEAGVAYTAILYKDGKAIDVDDTQSGETCSVDFADKMTEAGKYKVAVYAPATETSNASEVTESAEVTVEKLAAITDLAFRNEDNKVILSWKNSVDKDDFANYQIIVYSVDAEGNETAVYTIDDTENTIANDVKEVEIPSLADNTVYIAKAKLIALDSQIATVDSDEVVSSEFFRVGVPEVDANGVLENEITLNLDNIMVNGEKAKYQIKVFDVNTEATVEEASYTLRNTITNPEIKDGKVTITGLDSNSTYGFKLVATVAGETIESDYSRYVRTVPELSNLTIAKVSDDDAKEDGKIYATAQDGTLVIGGEELVKTDYRGSTKFADIVKIVNTLNSGDVITIDGDKISVKLDGGASTQASSNRDLSGLQLSNARDIVLEFISNGYNKIIKTPSAEEYKVKEVILSGDALYELTNIYAEKITITDGVDVTGNKELTVAANSKVTINNAEVTTDKETVITSSANTLDVSMNDETNDLVFVNKGAVLTINFVGSEDGTAAQAGSIVIESEGGSVTLSSNDTVNADVSIKVNSGDVTLQNTMFTGDKTVEVSVDKGSSSTIKVLANTVAPVNLSGVNVDSTEDELLALDNVDEKNLEEVRNFLAQFDIYGNKATITAVKDKAEVTIVFDCTADDAEAVENVTIDNVK